MLSRQRTLWADVPHAERRPDRRDAFSGCPYAVRLDSWEAGRRGGEGYRQCGGPPYRGGPSCWNHLPTDPRDPDETAVGRARGILRSSVGLKYGAPLADFRLMTDSEIDELHGVGVKTAAKVREIRDTWTDEAIATLTGVPLRKLCPEPLIPSLPCVAPHGTLSWLGG